MRVGTLDLMVGAIVRFGSLPDLRRWGTVLTEVLAGSGSAAVGAAFVVEEGGAGTTLAADGGRIDLALRDGDRRGRRSRPIARIERGGDTD